MYAFKLHLDFSVNVSFHWIGFVLLAVDFCVSGVPVRLLHFYQPLTMAVLYNVMLVIFTWVTYSKGPYYRVADFFSQDKWVRDFLSVSVDF